MIFTGCDQDLSRDHFVVRVFRVPEWPFDLPEIMPDVFCKSHLQIKTGYPVIVEEFRMEMIERYNIQQIEFIRRTEIVSPVDTFFRGEVVFAYIVWTNPVYCPLSPFDL